jgi:hypothetical protein
MNRYLLFPLLGVIAALLMVYVARSGQDLIQQVPDSTEEDTSITSDFADGSANGIRNAGDNVTQITSEEGLQRSRNLTQAEGTTAPPDAPFDSRQPDFADNTEFPEQNIQPVPPVAPADPPPADQDAIPALW